MTDRPAGVLLMAYGTPASRDEIEPYYTDIRRGRPPTPEQLADRVRRYDAIGGVSPLAERSERQRLALQAALDARAPGGFDVVLGTKHARPSIEEALAVLASGGVEAAVALVLAPHYSALSVGQYVERATTAAEPLGMRIEPITSWHTEPAYLDFLAAAVRSELAGLPPATSVVFTAHSLPARILEEGDPYPEQLHATAAGVAERAGLDASAWCVAWQSAGRTAEAWLGPDVLEVIDQLAATRAGGGVLVCACGFVSDHLEVLYDLDLEARRRAEAARLAFARTACVNDDAAVIGALAELVIARHAAG
jgi:ferrochelatase